MTTALGLVIRGGVDPDARRMVAAAGIVESQQKIAVNRKLAKPIKFVTASVLVPLWNSLFALYPFVGGNATAHAQNLVSALYPITWTNAPTQDANGVTGNGTTQYGIAAGLTGNTVVPHLHGQTYYLRNNYGAAGARVPMGFGNNGSALFYMAYRNNNIANNGIFGAAGTSLMTETAAIRTGVIAINRTSTTRVDVYQNGTSFLNDTDSDTTTPPSVDMGFLAMNDSGGTPMFFSAANIALGAVHTPHDATQAANFSTIIETYQDALGRGVV